MAKARRTIDVDEFEDELEAREAEAGIEYEDADELTEEELAAAEADEEEAEEPEPAPRARGGGRKKAPTRKERYFVRKIGRGSYNFKGHVFKAGSITEVRRETQLYLCNLADAYGRPLYFVPVSEAQYQEILEEQAHALAIRQQRAQRIIAGEAGVMGTARRRISRSSAGRGSARVNAQVRRRRKADDPGDNAGYLEPDDTGAELL